MPTILYPDVPQLPGVPAIVRQIQAVAGTLGVPALALPAIAQQVEFQPKPTYVILDADGNVALEPDSVVNFEIRGESKKTDYPVEDGSFSSYNKVQQPYELRMLVSYRGDGYVTRGDFLVDVELMLKGTDLFTIVAPARTYPNACLTHYDYRSESTSGATLLLIDLYFSEVRVTPTGIITMAQPEAQAPVNNGTVSPVVPPATLTAGTVR